MFTTVFLIPTGVGAAIGGYAGDAAPAARLLASVSDRLVTHPNALNAASLFAIPDNAWYVEGRALDDWLGGRWRLAPRPGQRVGLLVDRAVDAMPEGTLAAVLNAANAVRAVHGVEVVGYALTARPLGCRVLPGASGASTGTVSDPEALLDGARRLLAAGATAIAIVADLGDLEGPAEAAYREGGGVDPIGGLEAILSHLLVDALGVPAAHAPLFPFDPSPPPLVDPRAAAEYVGHTFLPCILQGLARHPDLLPAERPTGVGAEAVSALVAPAGALGGPATIAAHDRGIPVIAVKENRTVLGVTAAALGWGDVWEAENYLEAAGMLASLRAGLDWRAVRRPLAPLVRLPDRD